jgi:hypothetical protein
MRETTYMIQPEGSDDGSGRVCLLQKWIYGLGQSGRKWYFRLLNSLNPLDSDSARRNHVWWSKKKFCFSSSLMTSWQDQTRSSRDFEICWRQNSRSARLESQTHNEGFCGVCKQCDFTLSTLLHDINCALHKENKNYTLTKTHSNPTKFLESENQESRSSFVLKFIGSLMQLGTWKNHIFHTPYPYFPILLKSISKTLEAGSKGSHVPRTFARLPYFDEHWTRRARE